MDLDDSERDTIIKLAIHHLTIQQLLINDILAEEELLVDRFLNRDEMFEDSYHANSLVAKLLRGHPERI